MTLRYVFPRILAVSSLAFCAVSVLPTKAHALDIGFSSVIGLERDAALIAVQNSNKTFVSVSDKAGVDEGAKDFIASMANRGLGFLTAGDMSEDEKTKEFKNLLEDSFDMNTIARFALGRYWRPASTEQKREYLDLFKKMIVTVYTARFNEYDGQKFETRGVRAEGDKDAIVSSFLVPESGPEVQIDWRVRKKDGQYKIIDVIVEGVSMSVTQRSDFSSVIQRGGGNIEVLLDHLRNEAAAGKAG